MVAVELAFFLPFFGYLLVPAYGPREPNVGGLASALVATFLSHAEVNVLDAFPSAHTSVTLVVSSFGWRSFPLFVAYATAVLFSTVYLSLHYVVDLVAGGLVAALALALEPRLDRAKTSAFGSQQELDQ